MEIVFLGTGGGRFNLISQIRRTGGFLIRGSLNIHADPGPGALVACHDFSIHPEKTGAVVVTHNHIDHLNDAALMCEAINCFPDRKRGILVASKSILAGDEYGERGISPYFTKKLSRTEIARQGKPIKIGGATLTPTPVRHEDMTGFGFVLDMDGARIGYTSDTEYFPSLAPHFLHCDILIANNLKSGADGVPGHLYSATTVKLLTACHPRLCVLSHMGQSLLKSGPGKEARKIQKASGVRTVAATDGMRVDVRTLRVKK
ncbi:MAG: MBL fold metallo-hydrolase [Candidatus Micrarchaeota archaeon]|nr:MBL fold metallo-hydrolase [Candidatus Micrarchaeota archaeon]